jgi:hypothetical protein
MSKIDCLFQNAIDSIANIVPEKSAEIKEIIKQNGVSFEINDRKGFCFSAEPQSKIIRVSKHALEALWVHSYFYWVAYQEAIKAQKSGKLTVDLNDSDSGRNALKLMEWLNAHIASQYSLTWPDNLPHPKSQPIYASDEHVANEFALVSTAFCLHHELAHIVNNHGYIGTPHLSRQQEREADIEAVKFILAGATNSDEYQKRCLGIAISLLVLTSHGIQAGKFDDSTHPKAIVRLFECLDEASLNENHLIYAFVINILKMYMDGHKIEIPTRSFKSIFEEYLFEINRQTI